MEKFPIPWGIHAVPADLRPVDRFVLPQLRQPGEIRRYRNLIPKTDVSAKICLELRCLPSLGDGFEGGWVLGFALGAEVAGFEGGDFGFDLLFEFRAE